MKKQVKKQYIDLPKNVKDRSKADVYKKYQNWYGRICRRR